MIPFEELKPFARTERQLEYINAATETGSIRKAAKKLTVSYQTVQKAIAQVRKYAEHRGNLGDLKEKGLVPDGFYAETSVKRRLNPKTGDMQVVEDWTKSRIDKELREQQFRAIIEGLNYELKPARPKKRRKPANDQMASAIILGDAHIGVLTHAVETMAEDYNIDKAVKDIMDAIDYLVDLAPPSEEGWFINVGDFMHSTDSRHVTPMSEARLDMSARHNLVLKEAAKLVRYCVDKMLTKFNTVRVINARGNHDEDAAYALNLYLQGIYENEPRVIVPDNFSRFHFIEFGINLIGVNHGDKMNHQRLADVMTRNMAEAWGRTRNRLWMIGHIHHKQKIGIDSGVTIESFNTLSAVDYWHAASGYQADRNVTMITFHKEHGEVNRMTPDIEMIRAMAQEEQ
jgi:transposase/UDP-2,3-diacylglucosamine pyrophosphatase LpxH